MRWAISTTGSLLTLFLLAGVPAAQAQDAPAAGDAAGGGTAQSAADGAGLPAGTDGPAGAFEPHFTRRIAG